MIELTTQEGTPVTVNPAALWHVRSSGAEQTALYSVAGAALFVRQPYDEVVALLTAWEEGA